MKISLEFCHGKRALMFFVMLNLAYSEWLTLHPREREREREEEKRELRNRMRDEERETERERKRGRETRIEKSNER